MSLFRAIADGTVTLTPAEDARIWQMRASGQDWPAIEAALSAARFKRAGVRCGRRPPAPTAHRCTSCGDSFDRTDKQPGQCSRCRSLAA